MQKIIVTALMTLAFTLGVSPAWAAVWFVAPNGVGTGTSWTDATSLAAAVGGAAAGDEIRLAEGAYVMSFTVRVDKDLMIRGSGIGTTILDCQAMTSDPCLSIIAPVTSATVISDLTVTGATRGITVDNASPVLMRLEIRETEYALDVELSTATIKHNLFVDNMTDLEITDSRAQVHDNTFDGRGNTFCIIELSFSAVSDNTFRRNNLSGCSCGVRILEYGPPVRSLYSANVITDSIYGIYAYGASSPYFVNNLVFDNSTGIDMSYSGGVVAFNTFADNYSDNADISNSDVLFVNNILTGSTWYGLSTGGTTSGQMSFGYNNVYNNRYDYDSSPDYIDLGGNVSVDPVFASGGYELDSTSPLIGAASISWFRTDYDIVGNPREYDVGGMERPDIGAYEYTP